MYRGAEKWFLATIEDMKKRKKIVRWRISSSCLFTATNYLCLLWFILCSSHVQSLKVNNSYCTFRRNKRTKQLFVGNPIVSYSTQLRSLCTQQIGLLTLIISMRFNLLVFSIVYENGEVRTEVEHYLANYHSNNNLIIYILRRITLLIALYVGMDTLKPHCK